MNIGNFQKVSKDAYNAGTQQAVDTSNLWKVVKEGCGLNARPYGHEQPPGALEERTSCERKVPWTRAMKTMKEGSSRSLYNTS